MVQRALSALLVLGMALLAEGQVAVELINMPSRVHSFEPVYVLYSVENTGSAPLYLPAEGGPRRGPGVYFARAGKTPRWVGLTGDRPIPHSKTGMWLAPGERWLLYEDISYWLGVAEGEVSVQAVLSGSGRCGGEEIAGRKSHPLAPLRIDTLQVGARSFPVYRCWQGEVRSNVWTLTVETPESTLDREARNSLMESGALVHERDSDRWLLLHGGNVANDFPSSHYAYAVLAREAAGLEHNRKALDLHPHHPLNPWVRTAILAREMEQADGATPVAELRARVAEMDLPAGAVEYLEQQAWVSEHRRQDGEGSP